jgi:glutathione S-transferase
VKLYGVNLSPFVQRVKILAAAKGLAIELLPPPGGSVKSPEYLEINPIGKMPCLQMPDGFAVAESEVILEYLEDTNPKPACRPRKPEEKAAMRTISRISELYVGLPMNKLFGLMAPTADRSGLPAILEDVNKGLALLEGALSGKKHAIGAKFSLADASITPTLFFITAILPSFGVKNPLKPYPKLAKYWKARAKHAPSAAAIEEMGVALKAMMGGR